MPATTVIHHYDDDPADTMRWDGPALSTRFRATTPPTVLAVLDALLADPDGGVCLAQHPVPDHIGVLGWRLVDRDSPDGSGAQMTQQFAAFSVVDDELGAFPICEDCTSGLLTRRS